MTRFIRFSLTSAFCIGSFVFSSFANADGELLQPTEVTVALSTAYIPAGFDSNDRAQIVVEGFFPNTCYRVGPYEKNFDAKTHQLVITQKAYKYRGMCLNMIVPYNQTIQLGILDKNTYSIRDGGNNEEMGELPVSKASNDGPDDYLYASVTDAYVGTIENNRRGIILQGELPGNCWQIKEKRVTLDNKNVLVVMPILEKTTEQKCNDERIPFSVTAEIPKVPPGRYLLHVRTLNGQAINKLVDL